MQDLAQIERDMHNTPDARLPDVYNAAKLALEQCIRIDEVKDWADKGQAIASYARQAGDKTLERYAMKIRAQAIRRCGKLIREVRSAQGERNDLELSRDTSTKLGRIEAAKEAGMSKDQAVQAIRVANVPQEVFDQMVETDKPATVTVLADLGRKKQKTDRSPKQNELYTDLVCLVNPYVRFIQKHDVEEVAAALVDSYKEELLDHIETIASFHYAIEKLLNKERENDGNQRLEA